MSSPALRPRLLVVADPNGSGKTTVTERGLAHEWFGGCTYINPDNIARDQFGDWNSPSAVLQAAQLAQQLREECVREQRSLAFETVFSGADKISFLRKAYAAGYFTRLFFVATSDTSINAARVAHRVMHGGMMSPSPRSSPATSNPLPTAHSLPPRFTDSISTTTRSMAWSLN